MSGMIYIRRLLFAYIRTGLLAQVFVYTVPHDRVYVLAKGKLSYLNWLSVPINVHAAAQ